MSIDAKRAADRIVGKLQSIGIDEKVGQGDSHTAKLVRMIVEAVLFELTSHGEVIITDAVAMTTQGPAKVIGKGNII